MDKDKINFLAEHIEKCESECEFNMGTYGRRIEQMPGEVRKRGLHKNICKTAGCIAGTAVFLFKGAEQFGNMIHTNVDADSRVHEIGRKILGLTVGQADVLFMPEHVNFDKVTAKRAAKVLKNFVKTGKIKWPKSTWSDDTDKHAADIYESIQEQEWY